MSVVWHTHYGNTKVDKTSSSRIGTFGVMFEIFEKFCNWFSIWIISKSNFKLLILVWLDVHQSKFYGLIN